MPKSKRTKTLKLVLMIGLTLLIIRAIAPYAIEHGVNYAVKQTPGISGQIGDVDLALFRGAYEINDVSLNVVNGTQSEPLVSADKIDISILWSALFDGSVVAEMIFHQAMVQIVDTAEQDDQLNDEVADENTWLELADSLVAFSIDRVELIDSTLLLETVDDSGRNRHAISHINGVISNISNSAALSGSLITDFDITGKVAEYSPIWFKGSFDPYASQLTFNIDSQMQQLPVSYIDPLIRFYTPYDFEAGQIDFAMELAADKGQLAGYIKAGIHDLNVFSWREDVEKDGDNPFSWFFEGTTDVIGELLESEQKQLIASKIPIKGNINDIDTPLLPAIISLMRNAFVEAIEMKVENVISLAPNNKTETRKDN